MANFVSRANWGARPPRYRSKAIRAEGVTVHWGGPSPWPNGFDKARSASIVRAWQSFHMDSRGWVDIAYSAVVDPFGQIFEGRWRNVRSAANGTNSGNYRSYAICYLAGVGDPLTDAAKLGFLEAARMLARPIRWSHRDWKSTACPGDALAQWVDAGAPAPTWQPPGQPPPPPAPPMTPHEFLRQMLLKIEFCSHGTFSSEHGNVYQECVEVLQRVLNHKAGQNLAPDGFYGPATEQAVRNVQQWVGITVDGIAGPQTWGVLKR